jgi:sulfofructosephosphate aldolase
MTERTPAVTIDQFRDAWGNFSMLAIDQRESLRQMLAKAAGSETVADEELVRFKVAVIRTLSPLASAALIDRSYGLEAARISECPIILAADNLFQEVPGGPVNRAEIDPGVNDEVIAEFGASALKMLVPWLPDRRDAAIELTEQFMDLCRRTGMLGIVEGVVRPADFGSWSDAEKNDALVDAATDLGRTKPDLYKAEVPLFGAGDRDAIVATAQRITDRVECPWVVLSSGVPAARFAEAVAMSRAGGASGFLAGRAIWMDAIPAENPQAFLETVSAERLRSLASAAGQGHSGD